MERFKVINEKFTIVSEVSTDPSGEFCACWIIYLNNLIYNKNVN